MKDLQHSFRNSDKYSHDPEKFEHAGPKFEGISDDTSDVPNCDNNRINVEFDLVESLINHDTSIVYSSKIDPILEEFTGKLAHIALIPSGIVEVDFDPNDDTSSDDDSFENIEYIDASPSYSELVSLEEVNDVDQEEKEFDLEDIFQIQDIILQEKLLNVHRLISNIESLKVNPTPDFVLESPSPFPIPVADSDSFLEESDTSLSHLDNSLPEFETFSDHTEETRSGSTTTHANYSLPEYGYIKNHKKTVKNGQARTRESEEYKKKPKIQSRSQKSQASVKSVKKSQSQQKIYKLSQTSKEQIHKDDSLGTVNTHKNTLAEYMILFGADNRPPMLDKDLYDSKKSRMELYMQNRERGRMILELVENGPLIRPTIEENGVTRIKKYDELSAAEKIQADCDMKAPKNHSSKSNNLISITCKSSTELSRIIM
ncbi:hypothetical protein Tco_1054510 [Tanacetum coccineum]|uniref:Uncharacterized protein n=1 Tax=Tanacetum coccineum TaxID=301880 RepID=A0ABQ5GZC4_9ASTR